MSKWIYIIWIPVALLIGIEIGMAISKRILMKDIRFLQKRLTGKPRENK